MLYALTTLQDIFLLRSLLLSSEQKSEQVCLAVLTLDLCWQACEMFILELTLRSWNHSEENKRRTLQRNDIAAAITRTDIFDFLVCCGLAHSLVHLCMHGVALLACDGLQ